MNYYPLRFHSTELGFIQFSFSEDPGVTYTCKVSVTEVEEVGFMKSLMEWND